MAKIRQIGVGRKTTGTIDGITYYVRNGVTFARATPTMPESAYRNPAALKRQAIFKLIQMHSTFHLHTLRQTMTPKGNGTVLNRYMQLNYKAFAVALADLADQLVAGVVVSLSEVEAAISAYAAEHPQAIRIAKLIGYGEVFLTGAWPETITLRANGGDNTVVILVSENGTTTTITPNSGGGSTTVITSGSSGNGGSNTGGSQIPVTVAAPTFSGETQFTESTTVTMSAEAGASIYYTLNGSTPTAASTLYSTPVTLTNTTVVKALAVKDGVSSPVTERTYTKGSNDGGGDDEGNTN